MSRLVATTRERRLERGQWYTPRAVADLTLSLAWPAHGRIPRVLDPTCGDGVFLLGARERGVPCDRIVGVDIDAEAVRQCRDTIEGARILHRDLFAAHDIAGFDVVVGNPPYVRQERLGSECKRLIGASLAAVWPEVSPRMLSPLVGRGDLAAAVIARVLKLCVPGGRIAFVVSSALLDAGYAKHLWSLVNRVGQVVAIVDAPAERWFPDAAVNAVIVVIEVGGTSTAQVAIARMRCDTATAAKRVGAVAQLSRAAEVRYASAAAPETWAGLTRASPVWHTLAKQLRSCCMPLGELCSIKRGVTSGANDVFYMRREYAEKLSLEGDVLQPLVRSPRERGASRIAVDTEASEFVALICPSDPEELARYPNAKAYLWAHDNVASRPTLRNRRPWWALPVHPARMFLTKAYAARYVQRFASRPVVADQRVYALVPQRVGANDEELIMAILNSTITAFALESLGRASLGEGALEWTVSDARSLPIIDPASIPRNVRPRIKAAFRDMCSRPIGDVTTERDAPDRRQLDLALLSTVDLRSAVSHAVSAEGTLSAIHDALVTSCNQRQLRVRAHHCAPTEPY